MEWLEAASTMLCLYSDLYENNNKNAIEHIIKDTKSIKDKIDASIIKEVFSDLINSNLITD